MMKTLLLKIKNWLQRLSFKTGVVVLLMCIPFYVLSFVQFSFDFLSVSTKSVLWAVLFGLAKTFQYGGLTILGVEGVKRLKQAFRRKPVSADVEAVADQPQMLE